MPVHVDGSTLLLVIFVIGFGGLDALGPSLAVAGLLFLSIYLHELCHAWGAMVQGVAVKRIVLHGGGGFCQLDGTPRLDQDDLIIAAGPLGNLALWAVAGLLAGVTSEPTLHWVLTTFAWINLFLAVLNLMPVFPLDGGQLLHLLLVRLAGRNEATRICGGVGLICALAWLPLMLVAWALLGFVLFYFPSIPLHWKMVRGRFDD